MQLPDAQNPEALIFPFFRRKVKEMKLILSSRDFRGESSRQVILSNLPKPLSQCRVLFIPNEKWTPERLDTGFYVRRMQEIGFSEELVSIFDPRRPEAFLNLALDVIYVSGGNSFELLSLLRRCSFDQELIRYIRSGVAYVGGSAGAHLVSADLSHLSRYDAVPEGMTDFSGLNLFHGILLCHFSADRQAHLEQLRSIGRFPVHPLSDADSLIITNAI